jgi:hypothetical protein
MAIAYSAVWNMLSKEAYIIFKKRLLYLRVKILSRQTKGALLPTSNTESGVYALTE